MQTRFVRTGALEDLDQAILLTRQAIAGISEENPNRAAILSNLGGILQTRFERTGTLEDLDEAIQAGRQAVAAAPPDHAARAAILDGAGAGLLSRFVRTGAQEDLEEALMRTRQAVAATPADHPGRPGRLSHLGAVLHTRFERTGAPADLDEAIQAGRRAVAAAADDPYRAGWLSNLGLALRTRFGSTGELADLDEAILLTREAINGTPRDHPDRAGRLSNLGAALRVRFESTGEQADLDEAIKVGREAVTGTPEDHPDQVKWLHNLGVALRTQFVHTGAPTDRDEAIDVLGQMVSMTAAAPSLRIWGARAASELAAGTRPEWSAQVMEQAVLLLPEVAPRQLERDDQQYALGGMSGLAGDAAGLILALPASSPGEHAALALRLLEAGRAVLFSQALEVRGDLTDLTDQYPELAGRFTRLRDLLDRTSNIAIPAPGDPAGDADAKASRSAQDRLRLAPILLTPWRISARKKVSAHSPGRPPPSNSSNKPRTGRW